MEIQRSIGFVIFVVILTLLISYIIGKSISLQVYSVYKKLSYQSDQLSNRSLHIKKLSESLAESSHQQDEFVNGTASSMTEIRSMSENTSKLTSESHSIVSSTAQKTSNGKILVENMVESMNEIHHSSIELTEIEKIITEIERNTLVINEIVSETRLLADLSRNPLDS